MTTNRSSSLTTLTPRSDARAQGLRAWTSAFAIVLLVMAACCAGCGEQQTKTSPSPANAPNWADETAKEQLAKRSDVADEPFFEWYDEHDDDVRPIEMDVPEERHDEIDVSSDDASLVGMLFHALMWFLLLAIVIALAYFALMVYLGRSGRSAAHEALGGSVDDKRRIEALPLAGRRKDLPFLEAARQFREQGDYAEAIVYLFSHLLLELDKGERIRLAKGKTNRQYHGELATSGRLRDIYHQTMLVFEASYFGDRAPTRSAFEACWSQLDEFDRLLRGGTI